MNCYCNQRETSLRKLISFLTTNGSGSNAVRRYCNKYKGTHFWLTVFVSRFSQLQIDNSEELSSFAFISTLKFLLYFVWKITFYHSLLTDSTED